MPSPIVTCALAALVLCLGACGADGDSASTATTPPGPVTSAAAATAEPTTTSAAAASRATTRPDQYVLRGDGLDSVRIGDAEDAVVGALVQMFGQPTSDIVDEGPFTEELRCFAAHGIPCFNYLRVVEWDGLGLSVVISDWAGSSDSEPELVEASPNFRGFEYTGGQSQPILLTEQGITIGSTLEDLRSAFGDDLRITEDPCAFDTEYGFGVGPGSTTFGGLWGQLSREPGPCPVEWWKWVRDLLASIVDVRRLGVRRCWSG